MPPGKLLPAWRRHRSAHPVRRWHVLPRARVIPDAVPRGQLLCSGCRHLHDVRSWVLLPRWLDDDERSPQRRRVHRGVLLPRGLRLRQRRHRCQHVRRIAEDLRRGILLPRGKHKRYSRYVPRRHLRGRTGWIWDCGVSGAVHCERYRGVHLPARSYERNRCFLRQSARFDVYSIEHFHALRGGGLLVPRTFHISYRARLRLGVVRHCCGCRDLYFLCVRRGVHCAAWLQLPRGVHRRVRQRMPDRLVLHRRRRGSYPVHVRSWPVLCSRELQRELHDVHFGKILLRWCQSPVAVQLLGWVLLACRSDYIMRR